jgi:hypothetical protein
MMTKQQYLNHITKHIDELTLQLLRGNFNDEESMTLIKDIMGLEFLKEWLINPEKARERTRKLKNSFYKKLRSQI